MVNENTRSSYTHFGAARFRELSLMVVIEAAGRHSQDRAVYPASQPATLALCTFNKQSVHKGNEGPRPEEIALEEYDV